MSDQVALALIPAVVTVLIALIALAEHLLPRSLKDPPSPAGPPAPLLRRTVSS